MNVLPINKSMTSVSQPPVDASLEIAAPFQNNFDKRFYFMSSMHEEAMSRLHYLVEDGNFAIGMLAGPCGSGKSLLRSTLHANLDKQNFYCVAIESPLLDLDGMMLEIISQVRGIRYSTKDLPDRYSRLAEFKSCLHEQVTVPGKHLIISIDEAHLLDNESLEGLRSLSNISAPTQNLFTILLVGQPELEQRINAIPALEQRIGLRVRLSAMDRNTCRKYIEHRMQTAGLLDMLELSSHMYASLFMLTGGIPRLINNLLKLGIEYARINNRKLDDSVVSAVISDQASSTATGSNIYQDQGHD